MKYGPVLLVAVGCVLISGCGKETSTPPVKPPVAISIIADNGPTLTYRIWNNQDRPVFLQLQTESAVGYYIQRRQLPGTQERELQVPAGQNLGTQSTRLAAGQAMEFDVDYQRPQSFRVGIVYRLSGSGGKEWRLCWSEWFDGLNGL